MSRVHVSGAIRISPAASRILKEKICPEYNLECFYHEPSNCYYIESDGFAFESFRDYERLAQKIADIKDLDTVDELKCVGEGREDDYCITYIRPGQTELVDGRVNPPSPKFLMGCSKEVIDSYYLRSYWEFFMEELKSLWASIEK
jgi:hypothetical protein